MYSFKRLLVCLDLSDLDSSLVKAAAEYATFGRAEHIYFVTVVRSLQVSESMKDKYPDLKLPLDERVEIDMKAEIKEAFKGIDFEFHFDVLEGDPTHQIIRWAQIKNIDLIILGKKEYHIGTGVTSRNIVNIVHCSALFVTKHCKIEPQRILLSSDYSEASRLALQKTLKIANLVGASVDCVHSYEVPTGYHVTGKTYDEFAAILLEHVKDDQSEFLKQEDCKNIEIDNNFLLDKHGNPSKVISDYAMSSRPDLVVIGSKGRTALSSVLLGSVAAKIVEGDIDIPILVIKGKEDNLKLVEAILEL